MVVLAGALMAGAPASTTPIPSSSSPLVRGQVASARLAGHVTRTDTGGAVRDAVVQLVSADGSVARTTHADVYGLYSFIALAPADYCVTVTASGLMSADATVARPTGSGARVHLNEGDNKENVDLMLSPMSAIAGVVLNESGVPLRDVGVTIAQRRSVAGRMVLVSGTPKVIAQTDASGRFRIADLLPGDYYVLAPARRSGMNSPDASPTPADRSLAFVLTYFPGTDRASGATAVRVEVGRDSDNVALQLLTAKLARLAGKVTDLSGRPVANARLIMVRTEDGEIKDLDALSETVSDAQGAFSYSVPAGSFVLQAFTAGAFGLVPVSVSPTAPDQEGIQVTVHPLVRASGRLVFEGSPPPALSSVSIHFVPTDFLTGPVGSNAIRPRVNDDGTFQIDNLAWRGTLRVTAPTGWVLKGVMLDGRDIAEEPHDFQSVDVNGLRVVLTNRLATIRGIVTDGGKPVAAEIVVFAEDPAKLTFPSRFITTTRSAPTGDFRATGLLAGRYRVIALEGGTTDPEELRSLNSLAASVVLAEGESASLSLRLTRR
jgi:hypothetical protein